MDRALIKGHAPASIPAAVAGDFIPPGRVSRSYYILCLLLISKANKRRLRSGSSRGSFFMQVFARVVLHSSRGSFFIQSVHARQQCQPASRRHGAGAQVAGFPRHCDALCGPSVIPLGIGGWAAIMISEACMMSDQRGCHSPGCFSRPVLDIRRGRARTWLLSWR